MHRPKVLPLLLALLLLAGCDAPAAGGLTPPRLINGEERAERRAAEAELDAQLGLLAPILIPEDRAQVRALWLSLRPVRQARLESGKYDKGDYELRLLTRLSALYNQFTVDYLGGDEEGWGYTYPEERTLGSYTIAADGSISPARSAKKPEGDYGYLWGQMTDLMGKEAFREFSRFVVFTDGPLETVAYVSALDADGARWEIGVDPEDADDGADFTETVLHEYAHYLTLNHAQVDYTRKQTVDTYNEYGMVSHRGSYIDDFYQQFWTDYLDDCLVSEDTYNFFLRHYDDFVSGYASTDPSEDISECFTYFVLWDREEGDKVWQRKLNFFYDYPEMVELRRTLRTNMGLDTPEELAA